MTILPTVLRYNSCLWHHWRCCHCIWVQQGQDDLPQDNHKCTPGQYEMSWCPTFMFIHENNVTASLACCFICTNIVSPQQAQWPAEGGSCPGRVHWSSNVCIGKVILQSTCSNECFIKDACTYSCLLSLVLSWWGCHTTEKGYQNYSSCTH